MTKKDLAIKVINLRKSLRLANQLLKEDGKFGILCNEEEGPSFRESRSFWSSVCNLLIE